MRRGWITCVLLCAAWSAAPTSAAAAAVVEIGAGEQPSAVTDAAGTLHIVWRDPATPNVPVRYCRVPPGGAGCAPVEIGYEAGWAPHLMLRPADGALIVVFSRNDGATMTLASGDGGATWTPAAPVGVGLGNVYDAELTPDGSAVDTVAFSVVDVRFQRVQLGGGVESRVVSLGRPRSVRAPRVTHLPDGRPVVAAQYQAHVLGTRLPARGADPDVQGAWGSSRALRRLRRADTSDADSGPIGTWLVATTEGGGPTDPIRIWRWRARGFTPPRTIGALHRRAPTTLGRGTPGPKTVALDVAPDGRIFVAWSLLPGQCRGRHCLVYRRTGRRGFRRRVIHPVGTGTFEQPDQIRIAATTGGRGWLVWSTHAGRIRALQFGSAPDSEHVALAIDRDADGRRT
jgi:hypothetical protein